MDTDSNRLSRARITVAVILTVLCMIFSCLAASIYLEYRDRNVRYYPIGQGLHTEMLVQQTADGEVRTVGEEIRVVGFSGKVKRGELAYVTIKGVPNATYSIDFYLKSGRSTNSELTDKTADEGGIITWRWRVSSKTSPGRFMLIVHRENDENQSITYSEMYITVTK